MPESPTRPPSPGSPRPQGTPRPLRPSAPAGSDASHELPARTVTKKEIVTRLSDRTGLTKVVVKDLVQMFLDEIVAELGKGNRLEFREFGVFEIKDRAPRRAQNPRTMEKVRVPRKRVVKFKVGRLMRERVARGDEGPPQRGARPDRGPGRSESHHPVD